MCRNVWFSLASTAIVSACIFLFCVFFSIITNIEYMVTMAETTMGITVFFSVFLVFCTLVVDILYVFVDPRIKYE